MGRISYDEHGDDADYPNSGELWWANVNRSIKGKRGRKALVDLREALLAMPVKRLIARAIATPDGEVCAIGAALVHRSKEPDKLIAELSAVDEDEDTTDWAPKDYPHILAWAVVQQNDYELSECTAEERYELMLKWIEKSLATPET